MRLNALHRLGRFDEAQSTIDYAIAIAIAAATSSTTCRTARGDRTGRRTVGSMPRWQMRTARSMRPVNRGRASRLRTGRATPRIERGRAEYGNYQGETDTYELNRSLNN
jgi:hypothetical protein